MKPHKHAELIKAWADGAEIEFRWEPTQGWRTSTNPHWEPECEYRLKPEPKPDVRCWYRVGRLNREMVNLGASAGVILSERDNANLLITFDGETGYLKKVEML